MAFNGSYPLTMEVVNETSEKYAGSYWTDENRIASIQQICKVVDGLIEEFECESVDASVDEVSMRLVIGIECADIVLEYGRSHPFFSLVKVVDTFRFSKAGRDMLRIEFCVNGIWNK